MTALTKSNLRYHPRSYFAAPRRCVDNMGFGLLKSSFIAPWSRLNPMARLDASIPSALLSPTITMSHRRSFAAIGLRRTAVRIYAPTIVLCMTLFGCSAVVQRLPSPGRGAISTESRKLHELFESYFEAYL